MLTLFVGAATVTIFGSGWATALPLCFLAGVAREGRVGAHGGAVVIAETDAEAVEQRLGAGCLACPGCSAALAGWGHARLRQIRGLRGWVRVVLRHSRCSGCGAAHVLLPVLLLTRRADTVAVIGAALEAKAVGVGHRRIAAALGRPAEMVRGWLRRFAGRVEAVWVVFTRLVSSAGAGSGAAWAGRVGVGGHDRRGDRRRWGARRPVRDRRGAGLAGRGGGVRGPAAAARLARPDRSDVINTS